VIDDILTAFRMANVALTLATAGALFIRGNDDWHRLTRGWHVTIGFLVCVFLVLAYGSVEAMYLDVPVGARTVALTFACIGVLVGLWMARNDVTAPGIRLIEARRVLEVVDGADDTEVPACEHPGCIAARIELRNLLAAPNDKEPHQ
jgi:hypothetical protein